MSKQAKILSILVTVMVIVFIPILSNALKADSTYGPYGAYNIIANGDIYNDQGIVEGRMIAKNNLTINQSEEDDPLLKLGLGFNTKQKLLGYYLENVDYPTLIVGNELINKQDVLNVQKGNVNTSNINEKAQYDFTAQDSEVVIEDSKDIIKNIELLFSAFESDFETLVDMELSSEVVTSQSFNAYYSAYDPSLIVSDLEGKELTGDALTNYQNKYEEISSEQENSEQESSESISKLAIDDISIDELFANEKLIIRSDSDIVNFKDVKVSYMGQEINLEDYETTNENIEKLAINIVWVFPNAKVVNINNSDIVGTIYAPNADMSIKNSMIDGQIVTNNFRQTNGRVNNYVAFVPEYDFNRDIEYTDITLEYLDEEGNEIRDSESFKKEVGSTFKTTIDAPEGYTLSSLYTVEQLEEGMVVPAKATTIPIQYSTVYNAKVIVHHQLENGTVIKADETIEGLIGEQYVTSPLADEKYSLISQPYNSTGLFTSTTIDVYYVYALSEQVYTATVRHQLADGTSLAANDIVKIPINSTYDLKYLNKENTMYEFTGLTAGSASLTGTATSNFEITMQYRVTSTCSQVSNAKPSSKDTTVLNYSALPYRRATTAELEYDKILSTGLVEEPSTASTSEAGRINFGSEYVADGSSNTMLDYKYSVNPSSAYTQYFPMRQSGEFSPVTFVISNDANEYNIRGNVNPAGLGTYVTGQGINYQKVIGAKGYSSLMVRFEECQAVVSINTGTGTTTATEIARVNYQDFLRLDETPVGYTFAWNPTTKKLEVDIMYEKNNTVTYSGNTFTIDLSSYSFKPQDYAVFTEPKANSKTTMYLPYSNVARFYVNVEALQSPYIDTTSTRHKNTAVLANNEVYLTYMLNGKIQYATQLTSASNIASSSLPYNPLGYSTLPDTLPRYDASIYGYMVQGSYTVADTGITYKVQKPVYYGKNKHPKYSVAVDNANTSMMQSKYSNVLDIPGLSSDMRVIVNGNKYDYNPSTGVPHELVQKRMVRLADDTSVVYTEKGTYQAKAYVLTRDGVTGQRITGVLNITVVVTGATMDFGDAPESYGPGGALIGNSSNRYSIGVNRNGYRSAHYDAEANPQFSEDARGDDMLGMADEDGWFNMKPGGIGELNIMMDKLRISFPYTASNTSGVAFWIDYNQNGKFESFEGYYKSISRSSYDAYGMVNFDIDVNPSFSTLEAGDTTYARVRIVSDKSKLSLSDAATNIESYGETEDFVVQMYGKENEYQICTSILANQPTVTTKNVQKVSGVGPNGDESGVRYTMDIGDSNPNSNSTNSFYPDVKVTISSKQGIEPNTSAGDPVYFKVAKDTSPYEAPANVIHIQSRNKAGQPINLPFTFTFWDLDDFTSSNVVESASLYKNKMYLEGLTANDVYTTYDTVGKVEDFDSYLKLYTTKQIESEPSGSFYVEGTSLAKADMEIIEEARLLEIGVGLDLGELTKLITECIEPYEPKAQIQIFDQFYDDKVTVYNNYPFAYQSTNIAIPYFPNFHSVTQSLTIPEGIEFVDGDDAVKIYRRDFLGSRTEADWELVDPSLYTQEIVNGVSKVTMKDPTKVTSYDKKGNPLTFKFAGYEYRMQYNFQVNENMATGQNIVFKSEVEYNKGENGQYSETYKLNDVTVMVRAAFWLDLNTHMSDDTIQVDTNSSTLKYTYKYTNCDTCKQQETPIPLTSDIEIPVADKSKLKLASTNNFDQYEEILLTLYDYDMKIFEIPIRRWYPTKATTTIADNVSLTEIANDLNPIGQSAFVRAGYKSSIEFPDPLTIKYSQETIQIEQQKGALEIVNGVYSPSDMSALIKTTPNNSVPTSWQPKGWGPITVDDLVQVNDAESTYIPAEELLCSTQTVPTADCIEDKFHVVSFEEEVLDDTLETSKSTINGKDYKDVYFKETLAVNSDGNLSLNPTLASRYIIEKYSGRIYNAYINKECKLESEVDSSYTGKLCFNDTIKNLYIPSYKEEEVLTGQNDGYDADIAIVSELNDGMPVKSDLAVGSQFDYFVKLRKFGLNQITIEIADTLKVGKQPIGYYQTDGEYYFKRSEPTDDVVTCIKEATCSNDYQVLVAGEIKDPTEIKARITQDTSLLENYKLLMEWVNSYKETIVK